MRKRYFILALISLVLIFASTALAQTGGSFDLTWFTISSGGGQSSGASYELQSLVAEPYAGEMQGGRFALTTGTLLALQETPQLGLNKSVSASTAQPNDILTYQITLTATSLLANAVLTDTLPAQLSYIDGTLSGGATHQNGQIRYSGSVSPASPVNIRYQVRVAADVALGTALFNTVDVSGGGQFLSSSVGVAIPAPEIETNLILLYVNGDNDLAPYVQDLTDRVQIGAANPDTVVWMVLDWPGTDNSYLYKLERNNPEICHFFDERPDEQGRICGGLYQLGVNMERFSENLGRGANLTNFVTTAIEAYPAANNVALSLVGHGGGWSPNARGGQPTDHGGKPGDGKLGGLLWDNNPGDSLSTPALGKALRDVATNLNLDPGDKPIDLLYLDACLMGMWEVAYEIRDSVRYLLAAESWSWTSFTYDLHLSRLNLSHEAVQIGQIWLENEANLLRADDYPFTFSLIDLGKMDGLGQKIDALGTVLTTALATDKDKIRDAFFAADCFDSNQNHELDDRDTYCDLLSFVRQIANRFSGNTPIVEAANAVEVALQDAVLVEDHHNAIPGRYSPNRWEWGDLGGLSIYLPFNPGLETPAACKKEEGEICEWWKRRYYEQMQSAKDGLWDEFVNAYWNSVDPPPDPTCPPDCDLPPGPLPLEPQETDLQAYGYELWTEPISPIEGQMTELGLVVHHSGGQATLTDVKVDLYLGNPATDGVLLGSVTIPFLPPQGNDSTPAISWTPPGVGEYTFYAIIDPDDAVEEADESNNTVSRVVRVRSATTPDVTPPQVDGFTINNQAKQTTVATVTLNTVASDPEPSQGLGTLRFVEYQYYPGSDLWAPVSSSAWFDYDLARNDHLWTLQETAGIKYLDAWVADNEGNISLSGKRAFINHILPVDTIRQNQARIYRYQLEANQRIRATITPLQGDPDLYIWAPDHEAGRQPWLSDTESETDMVDFVAPVSGLYQVEVYGYNSASYRLSIEIDPASNRVIEQGGGKSLTKPQRSMPYIPLQNQPGIRYMPSPPNTDTLIFLPIIMR